MIAVYLGTAVAGAVSAFSPVTPVEPYLAGIAGVTGCEPVPLGIAAAVGQTAGKVLILLVARGAVRSTVLRRWGAAAARRLDRRPTGPTGGTGLAGRADRSSRLATALRRLTRLLDRRSLRTPIVLASALSGVPPLLATTVYAARTPMPVPVFAAACLLGRSIRFVAIAAALTSV